MEKNDLDFVIRAQSGDAASFGELYDLYADRIYRFLYYRIHHRESAEDITSLVFTRALEKLRQFQPEKGSFSSWLYRIARNALIDYSRMEKIHLDIDGFYNIASHDDIASDAERTLKIKEVRKYLDMLNSEQRDIVIMRVWDELSYQEIANVIGKTESNCKVIFSRAVKELRQRMPLTLYLLFLLQNI